MDARALYESHRLSRARALAWCLSCLVQLRLREASLAQRKPGPAGLGVRALERGLRVPSRLLVSSSVVPPTSSLASAVQNPSIKKTA